MKTNATIETLVQENEYLKSVINEKNKMIKEYLEEMGIDTRDIDKSSINEYEEETYETYENKLS